MDKRAKMQMFFAVRVESLKHRIYEDADMGCLYDPASSDTQVACDTQDCVEFFEVRLSSFAWRQKS